VRASGICALSAINVASRLGLAAGGRAAAGRIVRPHGAVSRYAPRLGGSEGGRRNHQTTRGVEGGGTPRRVRRSSPGPTTSSATSRTQTCGGRGPAIRFRRRGSCMKLTCGCSATARAPRTPGRRSSASWRLKCAGVWQALQKHLACGRRQDDGLIEQHTESRGVDHGLLRECGGSGGLRV